MYDQGSNEYAITSITVHFKCLLSIDLIGHLLHFSIKINCRQKTETDTFTASS